MSTAYLGESNSQRPYSPGVEVLGNKIKRAREDAGLSQEDLGKAVGVSREAVSNWESGKSMPRPKRWRRLTEVIPITKETLRELASGGDDPHDPEAGELTETEVNARILGRLGQQVLAAIEAGQIDMSADQFERVIRRLYERMRLIPLDRREAESRTIIQDLIAASRTD